MPPVRSSGTFLCLASAVCFGAMAAFGKLAYDEGATVGTLLAVRFTLAAALFWVLTPPREVRALGRRDLGIAARAGHVRLRAAGRPATSPRSTGSTPRCSGCSSTRTRSWSPSRRS